MDWQNSLKKRYEENGWDSFRSADQAFRQRLHRFCKAHAISVIDENPEGEDWIMLLKNGTELYVDRRSYDTGDEETDFWIEYDSRRGGIIVEFIYAKAREKMYEIIVPNEEIVAVFNDW